MTKKKIDKAIEEFKKFSPSGSLPNIAATSAPMKKDTGTPNMSMAKIEELWTSYSSSRDKELHEERLPLGFGALIVNSLALFNHLRYYRRVGYKPARALLLMMCFLGVTYVSGCCLYNMNKFYAQSQWENSDFERFKKDYSKF
eukprot:CAMPEP_0196999540 /NCGR_PEP_ID=MMETSP1380-20130617/4696_1 /TAXON_ID=5936 /ORGANISM="Euplotes crassus, Strain CT5" /LENGTH=142 /DNA_ID=CAMNT_0042416497 /DNA_START=231 /DNA_END=659 /DNA_ORIENTATION=+